MNLSKLLKRHLGQAKGQSVVEMAMLIPIFAMILFGIVEYSNMFMTALRISNISRTVANTTFRDCAFLDAAPMATCLTDSIAQVNDEANLILQDFESAGGMIIASGYAYIDTSTPPVQQVGQQSIGTGTFQSLYTENTLDETIAQNQQRMIVGEVFYPYAPITPVGSLMNLLNIRTELYEATIY